MKWVVRGLTPLIFLYINIFGGSMKKAVFAALVVSLLSVTACSKAQKAQAPKAPECSDIEVQKTAVGASKNFMLKQYGLWNPAYGDDYGQARAKYASNPGLADVVKSIDAIKLESIKPLFKDNSVGKCSCEAEIFLGNASSKLISYTAQKTNDGKLLVEISNR
jgi:hypothetical protein